MRPTTKFRLSSLGKDWQGSELPCAGSWELGLEWRDGTGHLVVG